MAAKIPKLWARLDAATTAIESHEKALARLFTERADIVQELQRAGYSWADIGRHLGVSRQRAQQIGQQRHE